MDSQHASSGEHPKIIGPPTPEHKLQTILEAVGKTVAAIEYGEVESRRGMHAAEAVVFHFSDGTALSIEIGSNARDLSTSRDAHPAGRSHRPEAFLDTPCASTLVFAAPCGARVAEQSSRAAF